jgi:translation initiation factor IF-2
VRLHELSKEMDVDSKELLALAKKLGLAVKSHSSNLESGQVGILKRAWPFRELDDEEEILEKVIAGAANEKEVEKKQTEERHKQEAVRAAQGRHEREAAAKAKAEAEAAEAAAEQDADAYVSADDEGEPAPDAGEGVEETEPTVVEESVSSASASAAVLEPEPAPPASAPGAAPAAPTAAGTAPAAESKAAAPAGTSTPGAPGAPAAPVRRGAKILGRIELNKADVVKAEATHAELERVLAPTTPTGRKTKAELEREQELAAQRKKQKQAQQGAKNVKWQAEVEEFAPVSEAQVAKPKFWERGPTRRQQRTKMKRPAAAAKPADARKVSVQLPTSVKELSALLGIRAAEIVSKLLTAKEMTVGLNQPLDEETVLTIAVEFNRDVEIVRETSEESVFLAKEQKKHDATHGPKKEGEPRPPVVVVMGHVDHGKTSLLDAIRKTKVVDTEHGGITQHMRAYQVTSPKGGKITFLDTPGHRAFTEMRSRGANVTDIVVLVVAADDGVMPQTVESVEHARAANPDMPIVVALNKIDKGASNALRVKQQIMGMNLLPEEFGGKVGVVETSATTGKGIDALLDRIELEAEVHDLRAEKKGRAEGIVLESSKEEGKGIVATVLVRKGTLKVRDPFLSGKTWGRVRQLEDDTGAKIEEAPPSMPVRVYGFKGEVPEAGDAFLVVDDEKGGEQVAMERLRAERTGQTVERPKVTLENLFATLGAVKAEEIPLIVKADMQGRLEVLKSELESLKHAEVKVRVLRAAVGGITEEDVMLASTSGAMVFGFGVMPDTKARKLQDQLGVEVRTYFIIYELIDDLKKAMAGLLKPEEKEKVLGHVEVRETFKVSKMGTIAGCFVTDGLIRRNDKVRVIRDGKVVYTTGLESLRRFKDDVREVKEGFECGIKLTNFDDVKKGDTIEVFEIVKHERELTLG